MSGYASQGDGELLALFVQRHEEAAFAAVVQRHSVMVWNTCRRILGQAQDTEDAAQAVFLALAFKAASLSREASVAPWLHRVARCVSLKARQARAARQERERKAAQMRVRDEEAARAWEVLQPLLDAELDALPGKYRRPLILFYLEGRTLEEVAAALRSSVGTVGSWLSRGRELLRDRMVRQGVVLSSVSLAALISQNASAAEVPAALVSATWKAAATVAAEGGIGLVSPQAAGLMKGALQAMFWAKVKLAAALIAATIVLGGSAGLGLRKILAREAAQAPAAGEDAVNPRRPVAGPKTEEPVEERRFEGLRALVIEPENYWGWDAAIFGALQERHLDVTYAKADVLEDLAALSRYDLVASNIRRSYTPAQVANLKRFVMEGGAFYGSWGGPMGAADLLREVCHVAGSRSVRIAGMSLIENTPLSKGIVEKEIAFPRVVGHLAGGNWEIVSVTPAEGGIPVAKDAAGNVLGMLGQHGKGRTAVLGFGPEQDKYYVKRELGPVMLDNLLGWLLEEKLRTGPSVWPEAVEVSLPARAEVLEVTFNGTRLVNPEVRESGSLKKVKVGVQGVREGEEATIRVTYKPLGQARNVETIIHLPWGSFPRGGPPAKLAEWLKSLKATACQPLLREGDGHAYYKGMPEDTPDPASVTGYKGNFLADFVDECHQRGIKVIGGVYFESRTTLAKHPDAAVMKKDGKQDPKQACFNNPNGQEYNLATVRHLLDNYKLDGVILDDNFELPGYECCCPHCGEGFKAYCARKGIAYVEPSRISGDPTARHWNEYKIEATVELAAKVAKIAHEHNVPAGGWVGASMGAAHLKQSFDFLGGMVYTEPPKAASLMHAALGKCRFFTLLWAPSEKPERMEQEVREAVRAGSATVGFWVYPPGHGGGGAMKMLEGSSEAIARAFGKVEEEWFKFYRGHVLAGDARFAILDGKVGRQEMTLRVKNVGKKADRRSQGPLDLEAVMPVKTSVMFQGPSGLSDVTEFVPVGKPFKVKVAVLNLSCSAYPNVPVRLSLPGDVEIVEGGAEGAVDLAAESAKEVAWVLKKKNEGRSLLRCSVAADPAKPDEVEIALVGKPEKALEFEKEKVDAGTLYGGAKGSISLRLENRGLVPARNITATVAGKAGPWLRVQGLAKDLQAPDWGAGVPSTASFRLAYDLPADAAEGQHEAELVIGADGLDSRRAPVTFEVVSLKGLVIAVVRSDSKDWPESTNEQVYRLLKGWSGEEGFSLIGLRRDDAALLNETFLPRIHMLYYGSIREVPQDIGALAARLTAYVKDGGWLVGDGYGLAWGMIDIRPELRELTGLKWAHPNSNDGFSNATSLRVAAKHPLTDGLEADKDVPMGFANYGGTVYRLTPVQGDLTVPIVLCDSEQKYPYVAIRDLGKGRCLMFGPLMGTFVEEYKTKPAQTIFRNLLRWRKAEWEKHR